MSVVCGWEWSEGVHGHESDFGVGARRWSEGVKVIKGLE